MTARGWIGKVFIGTSVDGMIARLDGDIRWLTSRGETAGDTGYDAFMSGIDHLVMGRTTYETVLEFGSWPFGSKPVLVLSTRLTTSDDRVQVVGSPEEARAVLDARARAVYIDGGQTIQSFLREGLVDEVTITRVPVLIGSGKPLFGPLPADVDLELVEERVLGGGAVQTRYRVRTTVEQEPDAA